jgi:hypothetical protein
MILAPLRTIRVSLSKRVELLIAVSGDLLRLETYRTPPRSPATSSRSRSQEKPDENTALAMRCEQASHPSCVPMSVSTCHCRSAGRNRPWVRHDASPTMRLDLGETLSSGSIHVELGLRPTSIDAHSTACQQA